VARAQGRDQEDQPALQRGETQGADSIICELMAERLVLVCTGQPLAAGGHAYSSGGHERSGADAGILQVRVYTYLIVRPCGCLCIREVMLDDAGCQLIESKADPGLTM
jgi:hypothetical protein